MNITVTGGPGCAALCLICSHAIDSSKIQPEVGRRLREGPDSGHPHPSTARWYFENEEGTCKIEHDAYQGERPEAA